MGTKVGKKTVPVIIGAMAVVGIIFAIGLGFNLLIFSDMFLNGIIVALLLIGLIMESMFEKGGISGKLGLVEMLVIIPAVYVLAGLFGFFPVFQSFNILAGIVEVAMSILIFVEIFKK